ncbi:MAG: hypothetical protein ACRDK2_09155 [Solirubrobacteraceae bacterium]
MTRDEWLAEFARRLNGQRNLEQVITNLLNHQSHQLDAIRAALA